MKFGDHSTVLIVNDDPDQLSLFGDLLQKAGYDVLTAENGREGFRIAESKRPDLVISDVLMPDGSGIEMCGWIRENSALNTIPILLASATLVDSESAVEGLQAGADDYLEVPFDGPRLVAKVARLIERKRAEDAHSRLAAIVDSAEDAIMGLSLNGSVTSWNHGAEKIFGYSAEEIMGKSISVLAPEDALEEFAMTAERIKRGEQVKRLEMELVTKCGKAICVSLTDSPIKDNAGRTVGASRIARDITVRKRADAELRASEAQLRALFENSLDAVLVADDDGKYLDANPAACLLLGISREQIKGRTIADFILPEREKEISEAWSAFHEQGRLKGVFQLSRPDGKLLEVDYAAKANFLPGRHLSVLRDATQRRLAEEERSRLIALLEATTDTVCMADANGHLLYANQSGRKTFRLGQNEHLSGRHLSTFNSSWARQLINNEGIPAAVRDSVWQGETSFIDHAGQEVPYSQVIFAHKNKLGEVEYLWTIARDITARKDAENTQRDSEQRYESLVHSIDGIVWELDPHTLEFTFISNQAERILGYQSQQWLTETGFWANHLHPEDRDWVIDFCRNAIERKADHKFDYRMIAADGRVVWLRDIVTVIARDSEPLRLRGVMVDITDRKLAEEALMEVVRTKDETVALLDTLLSSAPIGFAFHNCEMVYQRINQTLAVINGLTVEEHLGRTLRDAVPEMAKVLEPVMQHVLETREPLVDLELTDETLVDPTQRRYWLTTLYPVTLQGGELLGVGVLVSDITERKHAEEALRKSEEQFLQSQKMEAVGRLAGGIAHDFNNLLTAIGGYSELSLRLLNVDDPVHRHISEVKKAADRAAGLTRQLLDFSRKQVLQPIAINLNSVFHDTTKMLRHLIGEDIELTVVKKQAVAYVHADPGQLDQVLMNLAVNARDAMPCGGKLIMEADNVILDESTAMKYQSLQPGAYVRLTVTDTGCGMDRETQQQIFEPFFTTKEVGRGTGLGLSTVYGIIKQSNGHISVHSKVGAGTTFTIHLPQVNDPGVDVKRVIKESSPGGTETIMLVEDEPLVRELTSQVLKLAGYRVVEASSGHEALTFCDEFEGKIELLLTDVVMPKMSGRQLAEQFLKLRPSIRILYMSGYTGDAIVNHGGLANGTAFLEKPFAPQVLTAKVREVLDEIMNEC
jgi:two-component system cell cycle sensor histidine kinase/response regulator CckA